MHSRELVELAQELFARGASYKTVAASLRISIYTARDWMHRYRNGTYDALLEPERRATTRFDESIKARVVHMRADQGLSYNQIVRKTGISRATIRRWISMKDPRLGTDMLRSVTEAEAQASTCSVSSAMGKKAATKTPPKSGSDYDGTLDLADDF